VPIADDDSNKRRFLMFLNIKTLENQTEGYIIIINKPEHRTPETAS